VDSKYFRPAEVEFLLGDSSKARKELNRTPTYSVQTMCKEMVASDVQKFKKDEILKKAGF
jgi:GDPmannose 4,6-dehydratase